VDAVMGWQLLWRLVAMYARRRWPRARLQAYQARALHRLRTFVYAHSPFYRRFHEGLIDRPLEELPVLTKALMLEHFDELVTDRAVRLTDVRAHAAGSYAAERYLGRYWVLGTSGSSDLRGYFLHGRRELLTFLASFIRPTWEASHLGDWHARYRTAIIGSPSGIGAQLASCVPPRWSPTLLLDTHDSFESIVDRLNAWQPDMLAVAPSMLNPLAEAQLDGSLTVSPRAIFSSGEVLTPALRARVEEAWGQRLYDVYGERSARRRVRSP
jgi:phenylacetate-coenzyme A ligase PaaK-like adenylate-forming protein